jgi:hypothetical protein
MIVTWLHIENLAIYLDERIILCDLMSILFYDAFIQFAFAPDPHSIFLTRCNIYRIFLLPYSWFIVTSIQSSNLAIYAFVYLYVYLQQYKNKFVQNRTLFATGNIHNV